MTSKLKKDDDNDIKGGNPVTKIRFRIIDSKKFYLPGFPDLLDDLYCIHAINPLHRPNVV
jgi:hypothetical protein